MHTIGRSGFGQSHWRPMFWSTWPLGLEIQSHWLVSPMEICYFETEASLDGVILGLACLPAPCGLLSESFWQPRCSRSSGLQPTGRCLRREPYSWPVAFELTLGCRFSVKNARPAGFRVYCWPMVKKLLWGNAVLAGLYSWAYRHKPYCTTTTS